MQSEAALEEAGIAGSLVLKPKGLVGNCGLALQVDSLKFDTLMNCLASRNIVPAAVYDSYEKDRWEIVT
jgi:hypothetical protein